MYFYDSNSLDHYIFKSQMKWKGCKKRSRQQFNPLYHTPFQRLTYKRAGGITFQISKEQCPADHNVVDHKIPCIGKKEHSQKQPKESDFSLPPAFPEFVFIQE